MNKIINPDTFSYDMIDTNTKSIESCIVPLCRPLGDSRVKLVGSSLYVIVQNRRFMLSAAHVVGPDLVVPYKNDYFNSIPTNKFTMCNDKAIDIAMCELNKPLELFVPLTIDQFLNYHRAPSAMKLIAVGYPGSQTKSYSGLAKSKLKKFVSDESSQDDYLKLQATKKCNIIIEFDRQHVLTKEGVNKQFPIPNGMSGGGLFWLHKKGLISRVEPKLIGILTRWNEKAEKNMVATHIRAVLALMENEFGLSEIPTKLVEGVEIKANRQVCG